MCFPERETVDHCSSPVVSRPSPRKIAALHPPVGVEGGGRERGKGGEREGGREGRGEREGSGRKGREGKGSE